MPYDTRRQCVFSFSLSSAIITELFIHLFTEILKLARRESHIQISKITQCEQDALEMQVRAANMGKCLPRIQARETAQSRLFALDSRHSLNSAIYNFNDYIDLAATLC